jgi:hypothetical protein
MKFSLDRLKDRSVVIIGEAALLLTPRLRRVNGLTWKTTAGGETSTTLKLRRERGDNEDE